MVDVKSAAGIQRTTPSFGAKPQQNPSPGSLLGVHTTAQPLPILINRRHSGRTGCQQGGSVMPAYPSHLGSTVPARLSQAYRRGCCQQVGSVMPACLSQANRHECRSQMRYRQSRRIAR